MKSVILLQQSDMIHFEALPKQKALLRISELKPRLTKFIKKDLKKADPILYEEFKDIIENKKIFPNINNNDISKGSPYFKISTDPKFVKVYKYKTFKSKRDNDFVRVGSYFGDYYAVNFGKVYIKIYSRIKRLEELVENALKSFLIINNLGQRQSKGFGSFVVDGTTKEEFEKVLKSFYKSIYKKELEEDVAPLEIIHKDYQLIKSGVNESFFKKGKYHQKRYEKSKLFKYFCNKNIRWEKKKIKEVLSEQGLMNRLEYYHPPVDCINDNIRSYKYIRGLLGVAPLINFKQKNSDYFKITISGEVDRYPSPITFKVFEDIYAVANDIDEDILNKKFFFKVGSRKVRIDTPSSFDLPDFMNYAFRELNWQRIK
ncbi:hypothetical protein [Caminibacter pacificus]|uniref:Uncharacterized protein n=1 Tax=Caminibacter pacificus TaxID=1424653 RepID=A0AAJ4RAH4_9BACT|nr:hypothetical protein [Caminibacter pacificus]QCI28748.1 hypothetical protein C6V80_07150 [Caminibacter pacificus]ROR37187.1 hypothetical protein EDC58_2004 [Caminibacter pacificus]